MMTTTVGDFLSLSTAILKQAGIDSARLDALILIEDALEKDRAYLLAHPEQALPIETEKALEKQIDERATHKPLAYIRQSAPFYGRDFFVNEHVLVPRPESEAMIDLLKTIKIPLHGALPTRIVDVGTGSGCLGITAALELSGTVNLELTDTSDEALAVAFINARDYEVACNRHKVDLLKHWINDYCDVMLANLPYVPETMPINKAASFEPEQAIFSGPDGLDHYKRFWQQVASLRQKPHSIITESLPAQHHTLALLARNAGYTLETTLGFAQCFKNTLSESKA